MRSVCVYCGSSTGTLPEYAEMARAMGAEVARRGMGLVYGGGNIGLMGLTANEALRSGGEVIGIIPQALMRKEVGHLDVTRLEVVDSMHTRKTRMAELADGFIALPGGIGTMEEIFEILTWAQLGFHRKPCGILNVAGYYDGLLEFLERMTSEKFLKRKQRELLIVDTDPASLLDRMDVYVAPDVEKWILGEEET